jgi:hypothetical protein
LWLNWTGANNAPEPHLGFVAAETAGLLYLYGLSVYFPCVFEMWRICYDFWSGFGEYSAVIGEQSERDQKN